ncbi:MAG: hypothetical protein WKF79_00395 [Nocardioides sp.]
MLFPVGALWEYQFVANTTPATPATVVPPAAGWTAPAVAPFGTIGASFTTNLAVGTPWALGTGLWVRRALVVDGLAPVLLRGQIENACFVYLDGVFIGAVNPTNTQLTGVGLFELVLPRALLTPGSHQLAVLCLDEPGGVGDSTFFWMTAQYLPAMIPLWPGVPMQEGLGWLNEVMISENGSEERERLRNAPRHQYRMTCFVPPGDQQAMVNTLYGARESQWLVPVWSQVQHLGPVLAGLSQLDVETAFSEYRAGSLAIIWQSARVWQVVGVERIVSASKLALTNRTEAFTDAWIMPVRKGYLDTDPSRSFNGSKSRLSLVFNVEDNATLTTVAPEQYLGSDIYFEPGLLDGGALEENLTAKMDLVDEGLGPVVYDTPWVYKRPARPHRMMGETPEEAWDIRLWLHRRAGRLMPFWHPSFEADLRVLNTGAITTSLTVASDDYQRWAGARDHIAVETATGWLARAVTASLRVSDATTQLTLNATLGVNAPAIRRVCFLGLRRLNSDRVEISWIGGTVCTCSVPVLDIEP